MDRHDKPGHWDGALIPIIEGSPGATDPTTTISSISGHTYPPLPEGLGDKGHRALLAMSRPRLLPSRGTFLRAPHRPTAIRGRLFVQLLSVKKHTFRGTRRLWIYCICYVSTRVLCPGWGIGWLQCSGSAALFPMLLLIYYIKLQTNSYLLLFKFYQILSKKKC